MENCLARGRHIVSLFKGNALKLGDKRWNFFFYPNDEDFFLFLGLKIEANNNKKRNERNSRRRKWMLLFLLFQRDTKSFQKRRWKKCVTFSFLKDRNQSDPLRQFFFSSYDKHMLAQSVSEKEGWNGLSFSARLKRGIWGNRHCSLCNHEGNLK